MAFLVVHEVGQALCPGVLKLHEDLDQLDVVLELGIDDLNILLVLLEQVPKVQKRLLDLLGENSNRLRLVGTHSSKDTLCCEQDVIREVVTAHAFWVGDGVDLAEYLDELGPLGDVLLAVDNDPAPGLLLLLDARQVFLRFNSLRDETPGVRFNEHEL